VDFAKAGLLEGLDGPERTARERLLEQLAGDGFSLAELKAAVAEDRLALLPLERVLGGRYTASEIAERSGVRVEQVLRVRRALGFPAVDASDRVWIEEDVAAMRSLKLFLDSGMSEESLIEIARVHGESMSRLASTITGTFADTYLAPGDSERDVALRFSAMAEQLLPLMTPVLVSAFQAHVRESARRGIISRAEREQGQLQSEEHAVVCFADLVGFTSLGGEIDVDQLGSVARRLAELASDVATPPVRLIKTLGDAAMLVSTESAALVGGALALVQAVEDAELPALRAGVASGPAINRAGDFYGHSVNLASRVTGAARPGSVLCTQEVRDAAADAFDWSFAGRFRFKGVAHPLALHRARLLAATPPKSDRRRRRAAN
jgi:adenylate cyclase